MGNSFKNWDDRCSLERSLPDIGSVLTGSDRRNLLEHSLPVASVLRAPDHPNCRKNQFKSQFTTGSGRSNGSPSSLFLKNPFESQFTTGSERSKGPNIVEKIHWSLNSLPVESVLRAPHHPNSWQNSSFTTGSERSKEPHKVRPPSYNLSCKGG